MSSESLNTEPLSTKEDLAHICESVIGYQKGLEEIEKYIRRLNDYVANLDKDLKETDAAATFEAYGQSLAELKSNIENVKELTESLRDGERGLFSESRSRVSSAGSITACAALKMR